MRNPKPFKDFEIKIVPPGTTLTDELTKESWTVQRSMPVTFNGVFHVVQEDLANFQRQFFPWTALLQGAPKH